jgi:hypothetical protein
MIQEEVVSTTAAPQQAEPAVGGVLVVLEEWVQWFGNGLESYAEYYGLKEVEGQKNIVERMVEKVESFTGPLEETILSPPVLVNAVQTRWNATAVTELELESTQNQPPKLKEAEPASEVPKVEV